MDVAGLARDIPTVLQRPEHPQSVGSSQVGQVGQVQEFTGWNCFTPSCQGGQDCGARRPVIWKEPAALEWAA